MLLGEPDEVLADFIKTKEIGGVVTDFTPMRTPLKWLENTAKKLPKNVPLCQVCILWLITGHMQFNGVNSIQELHSCSCQQCHDMAPCGPGLVLYGRLRSHDIYCERCFFMGTRLQTFSRFPSLPFSTVNSVWQVPVSPSAWELMAQFPEFASTRSCLPIVEAPGCPRHPTSI